MENRRNLVMLKKAIKGDIPAPFSKNKKDNQTSVIESVDPADKNIGTTRNLVVQKTKSLASKKSVKSTAKKPAKNLLALNANKESTTSIALIDNDKSELGNQCGDGSAQKQCVDTSITNSPNKSLKCFSSFKNNKLKEKDHLSCVTQNKPSTSGITPAAESILSQVTVDCIESQSQDSPTSQASKKPANELPSNKTLDSTFLVFNTEKESTGNNVTVDKSCPKPEIQSCDGSLQKDVVDNSKETGKSIKMRQSLKISLPINLSMIKTTAGSLADKQLPQTHSSTEVLKTDADYKYSTTDENTFRVKRLSVLCFEEVSSLMRKDSCVFNNNEQVEQVGCEAKENFAENNSEHEKISCEENEDFSGTDSDEDFLPNKKRKRKLVVSRLSSSSSSSSSSGSSTGSSSSSSGSSTDSSSDSSSGPSAGGKKGKKRKRNVANWKRNVNKLLRDSGKEYISRTGKTVKSKEMKPPCPNKCRLSCATKFTDSQRQKMFDNYWKLSSLQRQRDFLSSCVSLLNIPVRRVRINAKKERKPNCCFSFSLQGKPIRVCKIFLLNTLGITERTLRTVVAAKTGSGVIPTDRRGKHPKKKQDPEVAQSVRDHINSIPRIESHYIRASSSREYIDGGLTISEMHRHYKQNRESENKVAAKYEYYAYIFNTEFNISFFVPKKDQCDLCEAYKNAIGQEKEALEEGYKEHQKQKGLSRKEKQKDIKACEKPNSKDIVAIYDLQAVMPVPLGETSAFFYKSKLNCYNFTVTDVKNKITTCFFWHEGLGNRGAIEIGTCVYKFLESVAESDPNCDVTFYSDNCCGQQKNRFMLAMYYYSVSTLNINSVSHKFLIRGHTQNEGDNAHSLIEKAIKQAKKSGPIYVPSQYAQLIRSAKKTGKAFKVEELNYDDFIDIKLLAEDLGINSAKDIDGNTVKLTEIRMLRFLKNSETYEYKTTYTEEESWKNIPIKLRSGAGRKSRKETTINIQTDVTLKPAYNSKININERKKKDLTQLLRDNIVPKQYGYFYESVF